MTLRDRIKNIDEELFYHQNRDVDGILASNGLLIGIIIAAVVAFILYVIEFIVCDVSNYGAFTTIIALLITAQLYKSIKTRTIKANLSIIIAEICLFLFCFISQIYNFILAAKA